MGKREVHVVVIRKWVTLVLLVLVSAAMLALLYYLSGKAYANESHPVRDMLAAAFTGARPSRNAILAGLMPIIANGLLFVPWGFLTFLAIDKPARPRSRTYVLTCLGGVLFAAAVTVWQAYLPTRVTNPADIVANGLGAFAGAVFGHLRKTVHVQFEF